MVTPPQTTFAARVQRALAFAKINQTEAAARLSRRLNRKITPQTIQHMSVKAASSTLTADLAAVCSVDPQWLASGHGIEPVFHTTGVMPVAEPAPGYASLPQTPAQRLTTLIDAGAISPRDVELLLQMAESLAKHAPAGDT